MADEFSDFVERVKAANPIEDVIEASGAEFKLQRKHGNYLRGESHDSLVVRVDEQYYVWNERGEKGDVFNWLEARRKWDFWSSLQWLAERVHMEMPARFARADDQGTRLAARQREDALGLAAKTFARWLWDDPEALEYARGRGWSDETIRDAGLGFSGRSTAAAVQDMRGEFAMHGIDPEGPHGVAIMGFRGDVRGWGRAHDVTVQDNWVEWGMIPGMMGKTRLVYPHWNMGRVRYLSARNILGAEVNREKRTVKAFNLAAALAGPRQAFYNHVYGRKAEMCAVVEGQADAVTLAQWEIPAVALAGASWEDHKNLLMELRKRHPVLYVGLDADAAGVNALVGRENEWPLAEWLGPMARVVNWKLGIRD